MANAAASRLLLFCEVKIRHTLLAQDFLARQELLELVE